LILRFPATLLARDEGSSANPVRRDVVAETFSKIKRLGLHGTVVKGGLMQG
jgi:hypothetical protein